MNENCIVTLTIVIYIQLLVTSKTHWGRRDRDQMVIVFTTTYALSACSWRGILDRT